MKPDDRVEPDSAVIVLLAAGESRRFGGIKQLAEIEGQPMVQRATCAALDACANVIVVTGSHADEIAAALVDLPIRLTYNAAWKEGMGGSIAAGIRHLRDQFPAASGALLCLADQPLLGASWLLGLLSRHAQRPDLILVTEQAGVIGPPVLFPRDCFADLLRCSGANGAQSLLEREADRVQRFPCATGIDVDTPEDLRNALSQLAANRLA